MKPNPDEFGCAALLRTWWVTRGETAVRARHDLRWPENLAELLRTLEQGLDSAWTPEIEAAWSAPYSLVSSVMQEAASTAVALQNA